MGKHKHKSKAPHPPEEKQVSEADAAAGLMKRPIDREKATTEEPSMKRSRDENDHKQKKQKPLSRKEKRQKLNEKNKWPQHPKITNPEQREKAYLRVAGIEAVTEAQEEATKFPAKTTQQALEEDDAEWRRFGRFLGGTDARTRHKAVKKLGQYLQAKSGYGLEEAALETVVGLSELDLLKLWKGLWFTLYMADKVPVQDELAKHIAKLLWCVAGDQETDEFVAQAYLDMEAQEEMEQEELMMADEEDEANDDGDDEEDEDFKILETRVVQMEDSDEENDDRKQDDEDTEDQTKEEFPHIRGAPLAQLMMRTFFRTLVREWGNMDKYRVDKFYTLTRYMLREIYRYMAQRQWSLGIIRMFNDALAEEALTKPPNGVRYHLIDIALEELVLVATKTGVTPLTEAVFLEVLEPYFNMVRTGFGDKTVQTRVLEKVMEKFLLEYSVVRDDNDENRKPILEEVHVGTVSNMIFELASSEETLDIHRKSLYEMHKAYERQRKKSGRDIEIGVAFQQGEDTDEGYEEMDPEGEKEDESLEQLGFFPENDSKDDDDDDDEKPSPTTEDSKKDRKKKDKEKRSRGGEGITAMEASVAAKPYKREKGAAKGDMDTTHHGDGETTKKEKKRKHKKKKHEKVDSVEADSSVMSWTRRSKRELQAEEEEETLTISRAEQKKAKQAMQPKEEPASTEDSHEKRKKKTKKSNKKDDGEKRTIKRRVSFDNKHRARSWKASMKGLQFLDPSEAASKTPEKSILLNKHKKSPINNTPKGRKRAVDYF